MEIIKAGEKSFIATNGVDITKANTVNTMTRLLTGLVGHLENHIIFSNPSVIRRDLDGKFQELDDTIELGIPAISTAQDFTTGSTTITPSDSTAGKRLIKLDQIATVDEIFTSAEMTLAMETGFSEQLEGMVVALRDKIDTKVATALYQGAYAWAGDSASTPDAILDIVNTRAKLELGKTPTDKRTFVVNTDAAAKFLALDTYARFDAVGNNQALVEGSLGRRYGFNMFESQNVPKHTAGAFAVISSVTYVGTSLVANNSTLTNGTPYSVIAITESGASAANALKVGDLMTCTLDSGLTQQVVVVEATANASSGVIASVKVSPTITAMTGTAITMADKTGLISVRNLAFHQNALVLASRPLRPYPDKLSMTVFTPEGIPLRLSFGTNIATKSTTVSLDCLYKPVVIRPQYIASLLG